MKIGYGRTSSLEQVAGLEAQERDLNSNGCERVFVEQLSSVATHRPKLAEAIAFARSGDEFVVSKLDRLARSVFDLLDIEKKLSAKGVSLSVLDPKMETSTPNGRLMFNVIAAVAQFEREMMLQRQREGIAKAKAEKRYKGRQPTALAHTDQVLERRSRKIPPAMIAAEVGISVASVYRIFNKADASKTLTELLATS